MIKCAEEESIFDWQEFITERKKQIEEKLEYLSNKYSKVDNELNEMLREINDTELSDKIKNIIDEREYTYTYIAYKQGLLQGAKLALILKKKNLNLSV